MSSKIDLLEEDVFWRYLSGVKPADRKFDEHIIETLALQCDYDQYYLPDSVPWVNSVYSTLTESPIAVAPWISEPCFDDTVHMPDGTTRFTLVNVCKGSYFELGTDWWSAKYAWLSQASAVFHKLGVSLDEDLGDYRFIVTDLKLDGQINRDEVFWQRRHRHGPIYLYIPPFRRRSRVFWSSDENGKTRISNRTCRYLGLPAGRCVTNGARSWWHSWPTQVYKDIRKWQVSRGFDPTTTDFARYLKHPIFDVIQSGTSRFEELNKDSEYLSLDLLFYDTQDTTKERNPPETKQSAASKSNSIWSLLTAPFSCEAFEGSDIPAVLM
ncbi:hypothetical protein E1B28_003753 [Marasmius oreades]|uniref:Uncharacterized protein n=1 Tax=Marasmius oreades TaxID=181124 RepID=A0A9P7UX76_9AGAR|nr:uncharacterized protein E1B28_003753 [Marasmius oreades]KAG7096307.1 hypothetical protein E1B28_003753 [Marasmius oreades]